MPIIQTSSKFTALTSAFAKILESTAFQTMQLYLESLPHLKLNPTITSCHISLFSLALVL